MNVIPCTREFFVVYTVTDEKREVVDLVECAVVAWEINDGLLEPIPADQLYSEKDFAAIRLGELYYGEFGTAGRKRWEALRYFVNKQKRLLEKQASKKV